MRRFRVWFYMNRVEVGYTEIEALDLVHALRLLSDPCSPMYRMSATGVEVQML